MPGRRLKSSLTAWSGHRDDREGGYESRTVENCLDATEVLTALMERRSRAEPTDYGSQRGRRYSESTFDGGACRCLMRFLRDWACWLLLVLAIGCFVIGAFGFDTTYGPRWSSWSSLVILIGFVCLGVIRHP
jgi:hypothetical protein